MNKTRWLLGIELIALITITAAMLVNVVVFEIYQGLALYVNFVAALLGFFVCRRMNGKNLLYIICVTGYLILSIMINGGGFGSVITFIIPLIMLLSFSNLQLTDKGKKFLLILGTGVIAGLFLYSIPYGERYYRYYLTKVNPNTLGMFLMFFFMIICVLNDFNDWKRRIGAIVLFLMAIIGMYNFKSRGTALALCCFVLMLVLPKRIYNRKRFFIIVMLLIVVGTAVPFLYISLYRSGYYLTIFGKSLYTGRQKLWLKMFTLLEKNLSSIFLGLGSQTSLWDKSLNVHNNFFNIIVNFGIVGFVLYYNLILGQIWNASKYIRYDTVRKALIMFVCAVLVLGFTETTSLWAVIYPFAYFGLIIANSESLQIRNDMCGKKEGV